jgi:hypothetical protein
MALVAVSALTVLTPGHAEALAKEGQPIVLAYNMYDDASSKMNSVVETIVTPIVNPKELACLARNIFFEAANEPEEGKVAVGLVTLNRAQDGRFAKTICGVVDQKLTRDIPKNQIVKVEKTNWIGQKRVEVEQKTVWSKLSICQFSWRCMFVKNPNSKDERWVESQRIAQELLVSDYSYSDYRDKYSDALYFHATGVRPPWAKQKQWLGRIGGHSFYAEKDIALR